MPASVAVAVAGPTLSSRDRISTGGTTTGPARSEVGRNQGLKSGLLHANLARLLTTADLLFTMAAWVKFTEFTAGKQPAGPRIKAPIVKFISSIELFRGGNFQATAGIGEWICIAYVASSKYASFQVFNL